MATTGNENPFFGRKIRLQLIQIEREIVQKGMAKHIRKYFSENHGQRRCENIIEQKEKLRKEMTIKLFLLPLST